MAFRTEALSSVTVRKVPGTWGEETVVPMHWADSSWVNARKQQMPIRLRRIWLLGMIRCVCKRESNER